MGLDKCVMTRVHYYSIMQNCLTALKVPVLHLIIPLSPVPLATTDLCNVSEVFPFPECYILGIIKEKLTLVKERLSRLYSGEDSEGFLP